ncbi:hypothetical protein JCM21900_001225 [Sporobolomyces salmonicolor]
MVNTFSNEDVSSRSSGGETVATGAGEADTDERRKIVRQREQGVADSLSRLEGRSGGKGTPLASDPGPSTTPSTPLSGSNSSSPGPSEVPKGPKSAEHLRELAKRQRLRSVGADEASLQRGSRSTLASFVSTTGESIYEDAHEPDSEDWEEWTGGAGETTVVGPEPTPTKPAKLPDVPPPDFDDPAAASTTHPRTPHAAALTHTPPQAATAEFADAVQLSPESFGGLDERTLLHHRQASIQAEASRTATLRHSIPTSSSVSTVATVVPIRRYSSISHAPLSPSTPADARRTSIATSPSSGTIRGPWHPKPLVLTPARTIATPLTSSSPISPVHRRNSNLSDGTFNHRRTHSNRSTGSSLSGSGPRSFSPMAGRASPHRPPISPLHALPRGGSSNAPNRRRSLGYVDSAYESTSPLRERDSLTSSLGSARTSGFGGPLVGAAPAGGVRRGRSVSEDTGITRFTGDSSSMGRFTTGESPNSSLSSWSEGRGGQGHEQEKEETKAGKASPLLDDREWEQQYYLNQRSGKPLEMVDEGVSGGEMQMDEAEEPCQQSTAGELRLAPKAPAIALSGPTPSPSRHVLSPEDLPTSFRSPITTHLQTDFADLPRSAPPSPPPTSPLPDPPTSQIALPPLSKPKRSRVKYDQYWNGESLPVDPDCSDLSAAEEESDVPVTPSEPTFAISESSPTAIRSPSPSCRSSTPAPSVPVRRKPIVSKGVAARSSASLARRSPRLSQGEPPVDPSTLQAATAKVGGRLSRLPGQDDKRRSATVQPRAPPGSKRLSGLAIWPPPDETRNVTVAPALAYSTGHESSQQLFEPESPPPDHRKFRKEQDLERARIAFTTPPAPSSGLAFSSASRRKSGFEPRDPRAGREEMEFGPDSFLDVLLSTEPPPAPPKVVNEQRWSSYSTSTMDTYKKGSSPSLAKAQTSSTPSPSKPLTFTQKLFGGLRAKSPAPGSDEQPMNAGTKRPISTAPLGSPRTQTKQRPVDSGPIELREAKSAEVTKQLSHNSLSSSLPGSRHWGSDQSALGQAKPITLAPPQGYASLSALPRPVNDSAEELIDSDARSLDSVVRPPPKQYALPPGLNVAGHETAPLPPIPVRSPRRPSALLSPSPARSPARTPSPAPSAASFPSSRRLSTDGSFAMQRAPSTEPPIGVRDMLRGQFLER